MARSRRDDHDNEPTLEAWWSEPEDVRDEQVRAARAHDVAAAGTDRFGRDHRPQPTLSMLGEEALEQVTTLTLQLQGQDVPGETYFTKIGRIENAKLRAEEIARADLLTPPPELQDLADEEIKGNLPTDDVDQALTELREELKKLSDG